MSKRIYIAGPYTKGDVCQNVREAIDVAEELTRHGFVPFVPHLTHFWHLIHPHSIDFWYDYDNEWIAICHSLLRLPGDSVGADAEVRLAEKLGVPVFYSVEDLVTVSEGEQI